MKQTLALALLFLLPIAACNSRPQPTTPQSTETAQPNTTSQPFGFYLLNLSWSPEYCATHPSATECAQHSAFILHGLWPQNDTGPFLENCTTDPGPRNPGAYSDIYPDRGLLQHERKTHGTCSGLSPDAFLTLARTAFRSVAIPSTLSQLDHPISLPPAQLINLFQAANPSFPASSILISCGNNRLTAVEVCLNKSGHPIACGPIRSCRAHTVRITPP
ncbi:MAG TPA: hypothetical protein VK627_03590 [Edaphobacter sp.]|nr:hypothetical protein [Edaphobacter sp.]